MKLNFKKRVLALATVAVMAVSAFPVMTYADGGSGSLALTSTITAPKYVLGVPKAVTMALNPQLVGIANKAEYEMKGITSPVVAFSNLSNLPVAVNVSLMPKVTADTTIVTTAGSLSVSKEDTSKKIYSYVEFAKTVPVPASGTNYDPASASTAPVFETTTTGVAGLKNYQQFANGVSNDFMVILNTAPYGSGGTAATGFGAGGAAAFRIGGQVSAYGGWKSTDFTMNILYDAQTILETEQTSLVTTSGTKLPSLGEALADSFRTYAVTSGFQARQVNLVPKSSDTIEAMLITDSLSEASVDAKFYTAPDCKTAIAPVATSGLTLSYISDAKIGIAGSSVTAPPFKTVTTVYVKFLDANGDTLGIFPITINPVL